MKFQKVIQSILESARYSDDDDGYPITVIDRDDHHEYQYVGGVLYEVGGDDDVVVSVDQIEHTEGNEYHEEQIDKYVKYIQEDGILQSFPVQSILGSEMSLDEHIDKLDPNEDFDYVWDVGKIIGYEYDEIEELNEHYQDYYDEFVEYTPEEFNKEVEDGGYTEDEKEIYDKLMPYIAAVKDYIKNHQDDSLDEYHLTDFNHRFWAIKKLGIPTVLVDPR